MSFYRITSILSSVIGIFIFIIVFWTILMTVIKIGKQANGNTGFTNRQFPAGNSSNNSNTGLTHQQQLDYSRAYSKNNTVKDSGIKDKPLSEAEKNVLYGK